MYHVPPRVRQLEQRLERGGVLPQLEQRADERQQQRGLPGRGLWRFFVLTSHERKLAT